MSSNVLRLVTRLLLCALMVICLSDAPGFCAKTNAHNATTAPAQEQHFSVAGRWRVVFTFPGIGEKHLIFNSRVKGSGEFSLLDTAADGGPVKGNLPAAWAELTNNRVSISSEIELPIGTCCREMGTLMLKGKLDSNNTIAGKALFITSTIDEENFNGFRSAAGTFTAIRLTENQ